MAIVEENPAAAAAGLPADLRDALPALIEAARAEMAPATDEQLVIALTQTLSLGIGHGLSEAEKTEFLLSAVEELRALPAGWALEGIRQARRSVKWPRDIVAFVIAYAEDYPAREQKRLDRLESLAEACRISGAAPAMLEHRPGR